MADDEVTTDALGPSPWGSRLLGPAGEQARTQRLRVQLLITLGIVVANLAGMAVATALIAFVLPGPALLDRDLLVLDFVAVPVVAGVALAIGLWWGTVYGLRTLYWSRDPERVPTGPEQAATAAVPRKLVLSQAMLWTAGLAVLTPLYARVDPTFVPKLLLGFGFSAIVVCVNSYLIAEFALRPITARVLEAAPSRPRRGLGVFGRTVVIWILGTGVPVALLMSVAVLILAGWQASGERLAVVVLALGGATLVFGLLLMVLTLSATVAPIRAVRTAMRRVEDGDLRVAVTVYDGSELGQLQSGFNHMVSGLREREKMRDLFGRHVGHDVAAVALTREPELGGTECEAAALFIDIIGSTTLAATRPAAEIVAILNDFFTIVVDEVEDCGGLINKFEGDAALAVFGAPAPHSDAAGAALIAARNIRHRLLHADTEFDAGIGVAAGRVIAGNVGSARRYEFTVIGDAVNEAARLCELAKNDELRVLTSATTIAAAATREQIHWRLGESVTLRGRTRPTRLARPRSPDRVAGVHAQRTL
ncbi:adenylate/guanylate cyclase domain-containing protein [Nocardia yunnanensis]|uniref:Adenylate/guanylate cyclase domain-containing protein n=1 Tax=Nocardia yunnanensis TaxID=2382165 RepID=A0A386ZC41_9NOCA|nr:adenylate/guanylate cyclase domain-containing protein [Nocardia yunnanensis]AYF74185.1 adenylate/guanylate cyclase domain-containing protein [Nocardia yunnanensis]